MYFLTISIILLKYKIAENISEQSWLRYQGQSIASDVLYLSQRKAIRSRGVIFWRVFGVVRVHTATVTIFKIYTVYVVYSFKIHNSKHNMKLRSITNGPCLCTCICISFNCIIRRIKRDREWIRMGLNGYFPNGKIIWRQFKKYI